MGIFGKSKEEKYQENLEKGQSFLRAKNYKNAAQYFRSAITCKIAVLLGVL